MRFGYTSNMLRENVAGIGPDDLSRHVYIVGSSGSGKSTVVRNLFKHLEAANKTGVLQNSSIYIDVKDEDAKLFVRQCENSTIEENLVTYLDINRMNFGINLLELPRYGKIGRETAVSRTVGHVMEMLREFYSQTQTFVQMERILRLLLLYLYSNTDRPTLLDLYEIIMRLQADGKFQLQQILRVFKNITGPEMKTALDSISVLSKESWTSLLNRIEPFATDSYLKTKFSVSRTTINFEKMLEPGNITIFKVSETETPKNVHSLIIMAIIIKIWFAIQNRASTVPQEKRTLVTLVLDEFQKIKDISVITSMLSQARTYNLGLVLCHQNLAQISTEILETIVGNTATQIYGRVSGIDAAKIAHVIDPHFSRELTDQIASQPDFVFTAKSRLVQDGEHTSAVQFRAIPPPALVMSEREFELFQKKMKKLYQTKEKVQSVLNSDEIKKLDWTKRLASDFRELKEWEILIFLHSNSGNLKEIVQGVNSIDRKITSRIVRKMEEEGLVSILKTKRRGNKLEKEYIISEKAEEMYFPKTFQSVGTAEDIEYICSKAVEFYLNNKMFVSLTSTIVGRKLYVPDMIAYDYKTNTPISVEMESKTEVKSNPEIVRHNMIKWKELGFGECHVWSRHEKINEIKEKLDKEYKPYVKTFVI